MKIKIGDTVKVIGKTMIGCGIEDESIKIGTICEVADISGVDGNAILYLIPINKKSAIDDGWWYYPKDVEKGHLEWIPHED